MDDPPEQEKPEHCRQAKLHDRHEQSALQQLPQAGNKETAKRGKNVARRTLTRHGWYLMSAYTIDKSIWRQMGLA